MFLVRALLRAVKAERNLPECFLCHSHGDRRPLVRRLVLSSDCDSSLLGHALGRPSVFARKMLQQRTYIATGERIRNYLGTGFLLSLILNALVTPLYPELKSQIEQVNADRFTITHPIRISTPVPKSTPPPPHRTVAPSHAVAKPLAVNPPKIPGASGAVDLPYVRPAHAVADGVPGAQGTSATSDATTGAATTGPMCSNPNAEASVIDAMSPAYPDSARDLGLGLVSAFVEVTIDAQGRLVDAKIYRSSSNAAIDQAALRAARQSSYAPKIVDCVPVDGRYIFHADFEPN
jgi:TonB family protein